MKLNLASRRLLVIDRVRDEVTYPPKLEEWLKRATDGVVATTAQIDVIRHYQQMIEWVTGENQFSRAALDQFGRTADGWLAAFAKANSFVVVTNEVFDPRIRRRVPLPNVCQQFNVPYIDTFEMLSRLNARFDWIR